MCVPDYTLARILTPPKMIEQQNPSVFVTSPSNMYQPFPQQQQQQQQPPSSSPASSSSSDQKPKRSSKAMLDFILN